jgi:hypothetical protein
MPAKKRARKPKPPLIEEFMIEVTKRNRERLEKEFGVNISPDALYFIPPSDLLTEEFWDWANKWQLDKLRESTSGETID